MISLGVQMEDVVNIQTLESNGFVVMKYPSDLRISVQAAMDAWTDFCNLPLSEKLKLSNGDRLRDFGYMYRNDEGPKNDRKEQFHLVRTNLGEFRRIVEEIQDKRATSFIDAIDDLERSCSPLIEEFAYHVQEHYGLIGFLDEVMRSKDRWTYRYLHYFGAETLAHPHTDRGGFTLHLHESAQGGEYLTFEHEWKPWPICGDQTIAFPGMGLQHRSNGHLKALCHQVLPTPQTRAGGRFAMVVFIDFEHSHRYNDAATRLQNFSPGFNYAMPLEEFQALFVPR